MSYFEGRQRWRSKEAKRQRSATERSASMTAIMRALVILLFGILVIQLINLQVIRGEDFQEQAEINALREIPIPANRGLIYDRDGRLVVQNAARFSATIVPGDLPDRGEATAYRMISEVIGVPVSEIEASVAAGVESLGEFNPAVIKSDLDREVVLTLIELEPHVPGLRVQIEPSRDYITGDLLAQILGYMGPISAEEYDELASEGYLYQDYLGKSGVELSYEDVLRGKPGKKLVEVDAGGRELRVISERRPIDGTNLVLTVDTELQAAVQDILAEYSVGSDNAAAAVMDVKTGELLSMVSLPTFDNNLFSGPISEEALAELIDSPGKPLVNHVISDRYPPGSTFKTIVGAAALQEGVASTGTTITSRGYINVANEFNPNVIYVYRDWAPLGVLDFYDGIAMSSNVYFYYLAGGFADEGFRGLGVEKVAEYARAFGLGSQTGIDVAGESDGFVPDADWKQATLGEAWTIGDTYNFGIGQGYVAATPIQMLRAITAIANGGTLVTPHVVSEYKDSLGNTLATQASESSTVPVDGVNLQVVGQGMRQSVTSGVARNSGVAGVAVAGKTGTAEYGAIRDDGTYETHGWFAGYAPAEDPEIAVVVFVQRGSGGNDASPAAAHIFDYYFSGGGPIYGPDDILPIPDPGPLEVLDATATPLAPGGAEPTATATPTPTPEVTAAVTPTAASTPSPDPEPTATPTTIPIESATDSPVEAPPEPTPTAAALPSERRPNGGVP